MIQPEVKLVMQVEEALEVVDNLTFQKNILI